jgi:hypothetical protein
VTGGHTKEFLRLPAWYWPGAAGRRKWASSCRRPSRLVLGPSARRQEYGAEAHPYRRMGVVDPDDLAGQHPGAQRRRVGQRTETSQAG